MADEKYNQTFFLDLAAKGKHTWNAWRRIPANKGVRVTFAGVDFSEAPRDGIDFSGFEFGDSANFSQCKWRGVEWVETPEAFNPGRACFTGTTFGGLASFAGAAFGGGARFDGAVFGDKSTFDSAAFGVMACFDGAAFGNKAIFSHVDFGDKSTFEGAAFGVMACFDGAAFGNKAIFSHAAFGDKVTFASATFGSGTTFAFAAFGLRASFAGAAFGEFARFDNTLFKGQVTFTGTPKEELSEKLEANANENAKEAHMAVQKRPADFLNRLEPGPDRFLSISFECARFDSEAVFSGRIFERAANFTKVRFYYPPDFDATTNVSRIDFTGAHIGFVPPGRRAWTKDSRIPIRLRALRKIAEQAKNHDLARYLYIEERKAERSIYLRQLSDELKKAPEELNEKLGRINHQKLHVWLEWRLQRTARNAHWLGVTFKIARLAVHGVWIVVMGVFWALADYGRSFARPAAWLGLRGNSFYRLYLWILAALVAKASPSDMDRYK